MSWPLPYTLSLLILILVQSSPTAAQNNGNISVGQSLAAAINGSTWLSPSGDFAFGFSKHPKHNNLFLLAIWYAKFPDTIVWYANGGNLIHEGSSVNITSNEGLVLRDPRGTNLWNTTIELRGGSGSGVAYGFMNDTGNFALKRSNDESPVWQSFDHPTDTLLPTQVMENQSMVTSRLSETSFNKGKFQLSLVPHGITLTTRDLATGSAYDAYYNKSISDQVNPEEEKAQRLVYDESGYMYIIVAPSGSTYNLTSPFIARPTKDYYQRATLNFDGVLIFYSVSKASTSTVKDDWAMLDAKPDNICEKRQAIDSGVCGFNSICSLDGISQRPTCTCPEGYTLLDPNVTHGGCVPKFNQSVCLVHGHGAVDNDYKLLRHEKTNFPEGDYAHLQPISEEDCKSTCLKDCFCAAAHFNEQHSACWKKRLPFSNGRTSPEIIGTTYIKVAKGINTTNNHHPLFPPLGKVKPKNRALLALMGSSLGVNFILLTAVVSGLLIIYNKKKHSRILEDCQRSRVVFDEYSNVYSFSYKELHEATNGFEEEIGRGGFGTVYKGRIGAQNHPTTVAVKRLDRISEEADKEFTTEVNVIGRTHHKNLVRFIGFCKEGGHHRLLVYEYMGKGTVADYVFGKVRPSWTARIQLVHGIARGLLYLHEECSTQIIHCDIKPQNILLDDYYNARISDFGLAKLLVLNQTHTNTAIRGTKGYVAPEWFRNKPVTVKVDVYSFGVLLLEIICCRRSIRMDDISGEGAILTDWAFDCYHYNTLESLVSDDMEALNDMVQLEKFVMVALWCIQEDPSLRPPMKKAIQMLEGVTHVPSPPCPTSFSVTPQP